MTLTDNSLSSCNRRSSLQNRAHGHKDAPMRFASDYAIRVVVRFGVTSILISDTAIRPEEIKKRYNSVDIRCYSERYCNRVI